MATTTIRVGEADFSVSDELAKLNDQADCGAVVSFLGVVRRANEGEAVYAMTLEHYPAMTEKALAGNVRVHVGNWAILQSSIAWVVSFLVTRSCWWRLPPRIVAKPSRPVSSSWIG